MGGWVEEGMSLLQMTVLLVTGCLVIVESFAIGERVIKVTIGVGEVTSRYVLSVEPMSVLCGTMVALKVDMVVVVDLEDTLTISMFSYLKTHIELLVLSEHSLSLFVLLPMSRLSSRTTAKNEDNCFCPSR